MKFVFSVLIALGFSAASVSAFYVFQDWASLNWHYARFEKLVMSNASDKSLFISATHQEAFRINCFADGLGVLLGLIIIGIGCIGWQKK